MKKLTKLLVLLLSVALVCTGLILVISADDTAAVEYTFNLSDAVANAEAESTITLNGNAKVESAIAIDKNLTINLNGYTLYSSASTAFTVDSTVSFTITGDGEINLDGALFTNSSNTPTVTVSGGDYTGIVINHAATANAQVISVKDGTYKFVKTYVTTEASTTGTDYSFNSTGTAKFELDRFNYFCDSGEDQDATAVGDSGIFFMKLAGSGSLTMTDSAVYTTGLGVHINGMANTDKNHVIATLDNSVLSAVSRNGWTRSAAFWGGWTGTTYGIININDSLVEGSYYAFMGLSKSYDNFTINSTNSIIKSANVNSNVYTTGDQSGIVRSGYIHADANTRFSIGAQVIGSNAKIYVQAGTRFASSYAHATSSSDTTPVIRDYLNASYIVFPDNTTAAESEDYKIVFDPKGDADYPYLCVKVSDIQDSSSFDCLSSANYKAYYTFSSVYAKKGSNSSIWGPTFFKENYSNGTYGNALRQTMYGEMFIYSYSNDFWPKIGTLTEYTVNGQNALKFYVTPDPADSTKTTRVCNSTAKTDAYMLFGNGRTYYDTANIGINTLVGADNTKSAAVNAVIVYGLDFATDSSIGYTPSTLRVYSRTSGGTNSTTTAMSINANGTLTFGSNTYDLAPVGEWNRLTAVCYTDSYNANGIVYYYLNGTCIGNCNIYTKSSSDAYLQGIRWGAAGTVNVGSSIIFDNVQIRTYANLATEFGEAASYTNDEGVTVAPVFKPELYCVEGTGESYTYKKDGVGYAPYSVAGIAYTDINEAITAANALDTYVVLNSDVEDVNVNVNGVVLTNGHSITLASTSYKANVIKNASDNILAYEFNSAYDATITYYWYIGEFGNTEQMFPEDVSVSEYFVSNEFGYGDIPEYAGSAISNVVNAQNYTYRTHEGWDYEGDGVGPVTLAPIDKVLVESLGDNLSVTLYPTYGDDINMTIVVEDNATGDIVYYTNTTNLNANVWSNFAANTTFKLLSDFTVTVSAGNIAVTNGAVYNLDFNGHTILYTRKSGAYMRVANGAILNVYSSKPGGMFYAIEQVESSSDKGTKIGAGVFIQLKDTEYNGAALTENHTVVGALDENEAPTYTVATELNIGTVTVGGTEYAGSNLTLAGDCLVEPRLGGYNASVNIDGVTMARVGTDYGAAVLTRYYYGSINITNTTFIMPVAGANALGNHANGDGSKCVAVLNNCKFLYPANGADGGAILYRNNAFESITFTNCVSNGRMNPCTSKGVTVVGENTAAYELDWNTSDYAEGIVKANYNVAMDMPTLSASDYSSYFTQDENGVIRILLWKRSSDTSIGAYGGAVPNGYLYIYPNGYEGEAYTEDATLSVTLPVLPHKSTSDYVTVTYKGFSDETVATEKYAKGGNFLAPTEEKAADLEFAATKRVHDGTWDAELPVMNIQENMTVNATGYTVAANVKGLRANLSIYSDFAINLYVPIAYADYITSITEGGKVLAQSIVDIDEDGTEDYIKLTVYREAAAASDNATITFGVEENGVAVSCTATINVASYAAKVLALETSTDADKSLMNYMLTYANEASKYFEEGVADATISEMLESVTLTDYEVTGVSSTDFSPVFKSATVDIASDDLAYVFTLKDGFAGTVTVKLGDRTYTYNRTAADDREIRISGLKIYGFAYDLTINASGTIGEEAATITDGVYNLATFTQYHITNAANEESATKAASEACLGLVKALYNYAKNAYAYKYPTA